MRNDMNDLKKFPDVEKRAIFTEISNELGIRPDMIEKDFWVSWVLNQLFADKKLSAIFLFKGGTSLSKSFNIIERFSEDIDLLLDLSEVADAGDTFDKERSRNALDSFKSKVAKRTAAYIAEVLYPRIQNILGEHCQVEISDQSPCDLYINYPGVWETSYIRSNIKLEIGAFAKGTPFAPSLIQSYIADKIPALKENPVPVPTVSAVRTFWEKATILHYLHCLPEDRPIPTRHSRHFYDVYMLGHSPYKKEAFKNSGLLSEIIDFDRRFYPKRGIDYDSMNLHTISLSPQKRLEESLSDDYDAMKEMIFGKLPSWAEISEYVLSLENEIRQLKQEKLHDPITVTGETDPVKQKKGLFCTL